MPIKFMRKSASDNIVSATLLSVVLASYIFPTAAWPWDSAPGNPTYPTHSYITEWVIDSLQSRYPELRNYRYELIEGSNEELHELPVHGEKYDINLEAKRIEHKGTNEGSDDIKGWWTDSLAAYRAGHKQKAFFLLGIMLHMIEDSGVPAHAHKIYHQGSLAEFDNFEFLALSNWKPRFDNINRSNPGFLEPWKYYDYGMEWTRADAPLYSNRNSFSKFWFAANNSEKKLLSNRQGRTCLLTQWALASALNALAAALN